jgi:hypothetical protein
MRSIIRNFILASAVIGTAALTTNTAMAAALVRVPFTFNVAGRNCPAGLYSLNRNLSNGTLTLSSFDGSCTFIWLAGPGPGPYDTRVELHFDKMGQAHRLQSAQYGTVITSQLDKRTKEMESMPSRVVTGQYSFQILSCGSVPPKPPTEMASPCDAISA